MNLICVSRHAVSRAVSRKHFPGLESWQVKQAIYFEVEAAFEAGRVASVKPKWAVLYRSTAKRAVGDGQVFVWNEASSLGWVVDRTPGRDVVVTAMHRTRQIIEEEAVGRAGQTLPDGTIEVYSEFPA